jgi:hypothetical protein
MKCGGLTSRIDLKWIDLPSSFVMICIELKCNAFEK